MNLNRRRIEIKFKKLFAGRFYLAIQTFQPAAGLAHSRYQIKNNAIDEMIQA